MAQAPLYLLSEMNKGLLGSRELCEVHVFVHVRMYVCVCVCVSYMSYLSLKDVRARRSFWSVWRN